MKTSNTVGAIAKAMAAAQADMQNPAFDSNNPHFRSKFASLAAVRNAVIPAFARRGISVSQELTNEPGGIGCTTILMHESGEWLAYGPFVVSTAKDDAQGRGSASTYARRYSLQSVAGVVGDEDDDAEGAQGRTPQATAPISAEQAADIRALADEVGADVSRFLKYMKCPTIEAIPADRFDAAIKALSAKRKDAA